MFDIIRTLVYTVRGIWPGKRAVPAEQPSMADRIRARCETDCDALARLPRGYYTTLARELGTDPTYVSVVAHKAGFMVKRRA